MTTYAAEAPTRPVAPPLRLGRLEVGLPVVLAPMAGITNAPYRQLCREAAGGRGLFVSEMITSRGLVEGDRETLHLLTPGPDEVPRSVQLYGVDPYYVGEAVRILVDEHGVDHVDLNFGCPVPKITKKGGGAALPWKRGLLREVLRAAVKGAQGAPVTLKTRKGLDDHLLTYLDAGRIAQDEGCAAIALHARTAIQGYSGTADWPAIATLKEAVDIPVLGNGDIWEASDAVRMVEQTGCDGVVVGRGCLGRPWLFADLAAAFDGRPHTSLPRLEDVARMVRRHAELLTAWAGEERGLRELRKFMAWSFKGFAVGSTLRQQLGLVSSLRELDGLLAQLDADQPFPEAELGRPRGRTSPQKRLVLPEGWLDDAGTACVALEAGEELAVSGG
ncbi:tRNA dihydrouridine synthase DusB [Motilibacter aurantiacus]|uniref:tRNA dihydrouridine synthase DusB n=1 Tax=Motilibacter aurantiacus TaxID=2714955 RepID=UPI00140AE72C|nr:tRNA dihydrouridine synthase DusB [Motilibacter aurantiacus]NHC45035.1 tRNA dihydrouridine synthase DusB [Motilibacter aurantiacus]